MNEERKKQQLIRIIIHYGYPKEFGMVLGQQLHTEKALDRMIGYLLQGRPGSMEEIADEMLAIQDDQQRWVQKKIAEHANAKYNELLAKGIDDGGEEDE
jgi:hypothetical protein